MRHAAIPIVFRCGQGESDGKATFDRFCFSSVGSAVAGYLGDDRFDIRYFVVRDKA